MKSSNFKKIMAALLLTTALIFTSCDAESAVSGASETTDTTDTSDSTGVTDTSTTTTTTTTSGTTGLVTDGDFASGSLDNWALWSDGDITTGSVVNGAAVLDVTSTGGAWWSTQFSQENIAFTESGTYVLSFDASATTATDIRIEISPTNAAVDTSQFDFRLTDTTTTYTASFEAFGLLDDSVFKINFGLGAVTTESAASVVTLDNITLDTGSEVASSAVTINVTDGTSALEGATVSVNGTDVTTDASGDAAFTLQDRLYTVEVTKDGYNSATEYIDVSGTGSFTVEMDETVLSTTSGYVYATSETVNLTSTVADWSSGTTIDTADSSDATYNPVIKLTSGTGWGDVSCVAFTAMDAGFTNAYTYLNFKINTTDYTTIQVKFPGADTEQISYTIATDGTADSGDWVLMTIALSDFGTIPSTISEFAILEFGAGTMSITDVYFNN